jgi:hypothetical protein
MGDLMFHPGGLEQRSDIFSDGFGLFHKNASNPDFTRYFVTKILIPYHNKKKVYLRKCIRFFKGSMTGPAPGSADTNRFETGFILYPFSGSGTTFPYHLFALYKILLHLIFIHSNTKGRNNTGIRITHH